MVQIMLVVVIVQLAIISTSIHEVWSYKPGKINAAYNNKFEEYHERCQRSPATQVDEILYNRIVRKGEPIPDFLPTNWGAHMLCMSKKFGSQDANGAINVDKLRELLTSAIGDETTVNEIVAKCAVDQGDIQTTARYILRCLRDNDV